MSPYDPMRDILDNIDKQLAETGIISKDVPNQNGSKTVMPAPPKAKIPEKIPNSNVKKSPEGNFENKLPEKKLSGLDKYLIFAFTSLILFTIAILVVFIQTHEEPAVLVGCFFSAFGGEILLCARIKKYKLHKESELTKNNDTYT